MATTVDPTVFDKVATFANSSSTAYREAKMQVVVASAAGGGAGAAVTTAVTFSPAIPTAAQNIKITGIVPDQDAVGYYTSLTNAGFNLVLNPRLAANTLAAGNNNVTVTWEI